MPFLTRLLAFTRVLPKRANFLNGEKQACAVQRSVQASRKVRNGALGQETLRSRIRNSADAGGVAESRPSEPAAPLPSPQRQGKAVQSAREGLPGTRPAWSQPLAPPSPT